MSKKILILVVIAISASIVFYLSTNKYSPEVEDNTQIENGEQEIIKDNCEQSGGTFINNECQCPFEAELGQTSASMYDQETGYCQTTHGSPGGALGGSINESINLNLEIK